MLSLFFLIMLLISTRKKRNDSRSASLENLRCANPWNGKWLQKQPRTHASNIITKWHIISCLLARASTCFNYRIIIVPVWRCEKHRSVWTTFQDVAFDSLLTRCKAGNSDPSKGNRLDLEVLRASSKTLFSMFANRIFKIRKYVVDRQVKRAIFIIKKIYSNNMDV